MALCCAAVWGFFMLQLGMEYLTTVKVEPVTNDVELTAAYTKQVFTYWMTHIHGGDIRSNKQNTFVLEQCQTMWCTIFSKQRWYEVTSQEFGVCKHDNTMFHVWFVIYIFYVVILIIGWVMVYGISVTNILSGYCSIRVVFKILCVA